VKGEPNTSLQGRGEGGGRQDASTFKDNIRQKCKSVSSASCTKGKIIYMGRSGAQGRYKGNQAEKKTTRGTEARRQSRNVKEGKKLGGKN